MVGHYSFERIDLDRRARDPIDRDPHFPSQRKKNFVSLS
jgi:hypothetical protein